MTNAYINDVALLGEPWNDEKSEPVFDLTKEDTEIKKLKDKIRVLKYEKKKKYELAKQRSIQRKAKELTVRRKLVQMEYDTINDIVETQLAYLYEIVKNNGTPSIPWMGICVGSSCEKLCFASSSQYEDTSIKKIVYGPRCYQFDCGHYMCFLCCNTCVDESGCPECSN